MSACDAAQLYSLVLYGFGMPSNRTWTKTW
jgi:hypothetical protein